MREKLFALALSGALALSLAACGAGKEEAGPTPSPVQSTETVLAASEPPILSAGPSALPDRDYQPWQEAYMNFLAALLQAERDTQGMVTESGEYYWPAYEGLAVDEREVCCLDAGERLGMTLVMAMGSEAYSLYDVDGDGVPELFVKYGSCEAAYTTQCYTFRNGRVVCIGEFSSGHSALYTAPGRSAVVRSEGHMGYAEIYEYPMEGGRLTEERVLFTEEDVRDYTQVAEIVPGAEHIGGFYTRRGMEDDSYWTGQVPYSMGKALVLPICDYYDGPAATGDSSERAREAILAVLNGTGELYGASGDHFYGDVGWVSWTEYIQPGVAYPYNDEPLEITRYAWVDMNGDDQEELLLRVATSRGEDGGKPWTSESTVVLSAQDGAVYAYYFGFYDKAEAICDDGTVWQYGADCRLSFWADQCYEYTAQREPSAQPVVWADGFPAP